jgi:hypothetical protein
VILAPRGKGKEAKATSAEIVGGPCRKYNAQDSGLKVPQVNDYGQPGIWGKK